MRLSHSVRIDRPATEVFLALRDLGRAVRCLPGARAVEPSTDGATGTLEVRLGRLPLTYTGHARLLTVDHDRQCLTVRAKGGERAGHGDADAYLTVRVRAHHGGAVVDIDAQLDVRGAAATLGRGVLADVAAELATGFAESLAADLDRAPSARVRTEQHRPARRRVRTAAIAAVGAGAAAALGLGVRAVLRRRLSS